MSNPWSPADPKPLPRLDHLLRVQMPGAPSADIDGAIDDVLQLHSGIGSAVEAVSSPEPSEILTRLAAAEAAAADAKAHATALAEQVVALTGQVTLLGTQVASLQASSTKLEAAAAASATGADATDAIHKRLAALEARAPARAAAPAARPAAASA